MTAKEYLNRYRLLSMNIDTKLDELSQLRAKATRVSPTAMFDKNGDISDRVGRTAAKIVDLESKIGEEVSELSALRAEITATIDKIEKPNLRTLLKMRYINGWKWEKVALQMNYSFANVTQYLHPQALRAVDKIIAGKNCETL